MGVFNRLPGWLHHLFENDQRPHDTPQSRHQYTQGRKTDDEASRIHLPSRSRRILRSYRNPGLCTCNSDDLSHRTGMWPPNNVNQLRLFFRQYNVYIRLVSNFARIASHIANKLQNDTCHTITEIKDKEMNSFRRLKDALSQPTVLSLPSSGGNVVLDTDECHKQHGTILMKRWENE